MSYYIKEISIYKERAKRERELSENLNSLIDYTKFYSTGSENEGDMNSSSWGDGGQWNNGTFRRIDCAD